MPLTVFEPGRQDLRDTVDQLTDALKVVDQVLNAAGKLTSNPTDQAQLQRAMLVVRMGLDGDRTTLADNLQKGTTPTAKKYVKSHMDLRVAMEAIQTILAVLDPLGRVVPFPIQKGPRPFGGLEATPDPDVEYPSEKSLLKKQPGGTKPSKQGLQPAPPGLFQKSQLAGLAKQLGFGPGSPGGIGGGGGSGRAGGGRQSGGGGTDQQGGDDIRGMGGFGGAGGFGPSPSGGVPTGGSGGGPIGGGPITTPTTSTDAGTEILVKPEPESDDEKAAGGQNPSQQAGQSASDAGKDDGGEKPRGGEKPPDPPPSPPPPPPKGSLPVSFPNPDDQGSAGESAPRPRFHVGAETFSLEQARREQEALRARAAAIRSGILSVLAEHGLDMGSGAGGDEWGKPNPRARAADEEPRLAGLTSRGGVAASRGIFAAARGNRDPFGRLGDWAWARMSLEDRLAYLREIFLQETRLDPRLRALLELAGWGEQEDTTINKWTTTFKPNPEDPNGPHGPGARVSNPSVANPALRPRTGRLL